MSSECPRCCGKTRVMETRRHEGGLYRRRKCSKTKCAFAYWTTETMIKAPPQEIRDESIRRLRTATGRHSPVSRVAEPELRTTHTQTGLRRMFADDPHGRRGGVDVATI